MSGIDFSQFMSYGDFAKKIGVKSAQAVKNWGDAEELKPVGTVGITNVYLLVDLERAMENHSKNAEHFRKLGYVHPDLHKATEDHRDRLIMVTIERDAEIKALRKRDAKLTALEDAGVDNWSGYDTAMSTLYSESDNDSSDL